MRHTARTRGLTRVGLLLLALAALLPGGSERAGAAAAKFAPAGEGFSVNFPGRPRRTQQKQNQGAFQINLCNYGFAQGEMAFFVAWVGDLPAFVMQQPELDEIFYRRLEENLVFGARLAGKRDLSVASRSNITADGFDGRQYVFNSSTDMGVLRAYKAGLRYYAVGVFGSKQSFAAQQAVDFLESFQLTQGK